MGLLSGLFGNSDATTGGADAGDVLGALGQGLLTGDRYHIFGAGLANAVNFTNKNATAGASRSALKALLMQAGYSDVEAEKLSSSEGVAKLAIQQKQQSKLLGDGAEAEPALFGGGAAPSMMPRAPGGPAAGVSMNGGGQIPGSLTLAPTDEDTAIRTVLAEAGNQGPDGMKAVAGVLRNRALLAGTSVAAEALKPNQFEPWNPNSGNDPRRFKVDSPEYQAAKALVVPVLRGEAPDPTGGGTHFYAPKAQAALGRNAPKWDDGTGVDLGDHRFFRRPYAGKDPSVLAVAGAPTQVASNDPLAGFVPSPGGGADNPDPGAAADRTARPVQIANDENQTQVLEGRMSMYPPSVYGTAASAPAPKYGPDTATGRALAARQAGAAGSSPVAAVDPADVPAQGSQEAGFVIPPGAAAKVESSVGKPPTPVSETTGPTTQRAQALANFNYWGKRLRASAALGDAGKGLMEEAKIKMGLAQKFLEPSEAERLADAAGLSGSDRQQVLSGAIPGNAPTGERKDFEYAQRTPGYEEYQKRMKEAGRSQVNIDQRAEGKFEDGLGSKSADRFNTYIETGDKAKARLGDVNVLRETSRAIGGLGKAADFRAAVGPYLEAGGIKIDGLSDIQLFQSTAARLAPQLREPGAGATSDRDLAGFEKAIGSLSATPEARERILDVFEAASRNQVEAGKIARDVAAKRITRLEGEDKLQNLPDPMTSFREYRKANPDPGAPQKTEAPKPLNTTDRAVSISNAKAFLRANPGQREAVMQRLRDNGIPTDGL